MVAKKKAELDKIVVPSVNLKGHTLQDAIGFAVSRSAEVVRVPKSEIITISARFSKAEFFPNFRKDADEADDDVIDKRIDFQTRNITLPDLLIECAKQVNMDLYTTSSGVVFCPPGSKPFPNGAADTGEVWEQLYQAGKAK